MGYDGCSSHLPVQVEIWSKLFLYMEKKKHKQVLLTLLYLFLNYIFLAAAKSLCFKVQGSLSFLLKNPSGIHLEMLNCRAVCLKRYKIWMISGI